MMAKPNEKTDADFYCPTCNGPVDDPLRCGDCSALICRKCGTPLEKIDELGIG
jgi:hypothetical protein